MDPQNRIVGEGLSKWPPGTHWVNDDDYQEFGESRLKSLKSEYWSSRSFDDDIFCGTALAIDLRYLSQLIGQKSMPLTAETFEDAQCTPLVART